MSKEFNASNSVINLGDAGGSIINSVNINHNISQPDLISILQDLKRILADTSIQKIDKEELGIQITILDTQTKSSKPNSSIIQECMRTVRSILESMTGNAAYAVLAQVSKFI